MLAAEQGADFWIFRIGGIAAIVGSVIGMVGNLLHPATPLGDPTGTAMVIAESSSWVSVHLAIVLGIFLMMLGLVAVSRSINHGLAGALAAFGLMAAVAGVTIGMVLVITDGVAAKQLAEVWALSPANQHPMALGDLMANETVNFSLASLFNFVFAGATFGLFGLAVSLSRVYPRWLGWVAVAAALLSVAAGLVQAYTGEPTSASRLLTIIGPTVITAWLLVIGIFLIRLGKEAQAATPSEQGATR
jgi:hypothetical protein